METTKNEITGYLVNVKNFNGHAKDFVINNSFLAHSEALGEPPLEEYLKDESYKVVNYEELCDLMTKYELEKVKSRFKEITLERWEEMLEVLPPLKWHTIASRWNVFFLSEMTTGSYTLMYVKDKQTGKCYEGTKNVRTPDEIHLAEIKAEILGE